MKRATIAAAATTIFWELTLSAPPVNVAMLAVGLVKLATGRLLYDTVLVPEKTGAALVTGAGIGTSPTLTA